MAKQRQTAARAAFSITSAIVIAGTALGGASTPPALANVAASTPASAGAIVIDWNRELLQIVQTPGAQPPTVHPTRSFALLQAAIYDAVVSVKRDANPYLFSVPAPRGANAEAAAIEAGRAVLASLYPSWQGQLDSLATRQLAAVRPGDGRDEGAAVGDSVASILLAVHAGDGSQVLPPPFIASTGPGQYRSTPPNFPAPAFTNWGTVRPFVLSSGAQFRPAPPPDLTSEAYAAAFDEVERLGSATSTARTDDQTVAAKFWAPPIWNTWNGLAETQAAAHGLNLERTAALFAALDLSFADASISFYDAKYHYLEWRPVTAIRLANTDGNAWTVQDASWLPLANTAPDPSYPGAHSTISAAGAAVLTAFFGARDRIAVSSAAMPGVTRSFTTYAAVASEAGLSRIYAGQHFRFDHEAGLALGDSVARYVLGRTGIASADGNDGDGDSD